MSVSKEDCQAIILKHKGPFCKYLNHEITSSRNHNNFGSNNGTLIIYYGSKNGDSCSEIYFIKKIDEAVNPHTDNKKVNKEVSVYTEIFSKVNYYFEPNKQLVPICYEAIRGNFIVLEDLRRKNYQVVAEHLTIFHIESIVMTLARFHSASIITEHERSQTLAKPYTFNNDLNIDLDDIRYLYNKSKTHYTIMRNNTETVIHIVQLLIKNKTSVKIIEEIANIFYNDSDVFSSPSNIYLNVLAHNDLWKSNIMFNDDLNAILLDFQYTIYVPPAYDLLCAIFFNAANEIIENNFDRLIEMYYECLCTSLSEHDLNPNRILSRADFLKSVTIFQKYALFNAMVLGTFVFLDDKKRKLVHDEHFSYDLNKALKFWDDEIEVNNSLKDKYVYLINRFYKVCLIN